MPMRWTTAVLVAASVLAGSAAAQTNQGQSAVASDTPTAGGSKWAGYGSVGVGFLPEYDGASSYVLLPYIEGRLNYDNYYMRFEGGQLRFNILDSESFHFGPLIGFRRGRGNVNSPVRLFHHLDDTETAGGFIEYEHVAEDPRSGESITVSADDAVYGEKTGGWTIVTRAIARRPLDFINPGFIVSLSADLTWASHPYMRTYYGVSPSDSAASGLPTFNPSDSFSGAGVALSIDQFLSRHFSIGLRGHYGRELGDAADSPVTRSPDQWFAGAVVGYVL